MGDLNPEAVREAVARGLAPLERRVAKLKNENTLKAWNKLAKSTKKLLSGDATVDEWKGALGDFSARAARSVGGADAEAIIQEANGAAIIVEEAFDPPSPMRWLIFGGAAATALVYWWLKKEEKEKSRIPVATPEIIAGTPRKGRRPAIEVEEAEAEFEEIS